MTQIFNLILFQPFMNILVFFYNTVAFHDLGLAIIFLTILIRLILFPLTLSQIKGQKHLIDLQPKLDEIKKKYATDKTKQAKEMMALYQSRKINPFSSCLPLIIQFPILIAVYEVFRSGILNENLPLYSFIVNPGKLNLIAFGFLNLSQQNFILAVLTGVVQYFQTKMLSTKKPPTSLATKDGVKDESMMVKMNKQMMFLAPILTIIIGASLPSGLVFYWLISTLLTIVQQLVIFKKKENVIPVK